MSAAETYAARVDAVLAQRLRLRGSQPSGDLFGGLPPAHPLMSSDGRRELEPNLAIIASYVEPDDIIVDVGGGAGRISLPLALRCRELIDVDPSPTMLAGFERNARASGIDNVRTIQGTWPDVEVPPATFALVNHVTYLTREIVAFLEKLNAVASRRVLITVNYPPPPSWNSAVFPLIFGETEEIVPGHMDLIQVLWEMGIQPDVRFQSSPSASYPAAPSREAAIEVWAPRIGIEQWAIWPMDAETVARINDLLTSRCDELFAETPSGFVPTWITWGREVVITWETGG